MNLSGSKMIPPGRVFSLRKFIRSPAVPNPRTKRQHAIASTYNYQITHSRGWIYINWVLSINNADRIFSLVASFLQISRRILVSWTATELQFWQSPILCYELEVLGPWLLASWLCPSRPSGFQGLHSLHSLQALISCNPRNLSKSWHHSHN